MKRIVNAFLGKLNLGKRGYSVFVLCATTAVALPAQTLTTLFSFDYSTNYGGSFSAPVQATNGDFYGTATYGGAGANCTYQYGCGTVFKITPGGTLTTLYNFCSQSGCADGDYPFGALVQATNGNFYGITGEGGANNWGTVFKITPGGTLTTLHSFCSHTGCPDGGQPNGPLVQTTNGDFYGTASAGGANCAPYGCGTVFKITPSGTLTTLYRFCSQSGCTDGSSPNAGLVQATNGDLYGTTNTGGANPGPVGIGAGTVFKITPSGTLTTLYSFCSQTGCPDGFYPGNVYGGAALVQATNGDFYGTISNGGSNGWGTIFKITPSGTLTTLYSSFCAQSGGPCVPFAGLVQATDGDLYGTTNQGGANPSNYGGTAGTVFKITPSGTLTTVYSFCSQSGCTDGQNPIAGLVQATNGDFYGTTQGAGAYNYGTVFSLSVGLGPFVETQTTSGKVGAAVKILGNGLTGATSVSFHGTAAVFTVVSPSLITTTVPAGATTGKVEVVTPRRTLSSKVPFRVRP